MHFQYFLIKQSQEEQGKPAFLSFSRLSDHQNTLTFFKLDHLIQKNINPDEPDNCI